MPSRREAFTIRVLQAGWQAPAGVGFLVDETHLVTCAHVVNVALGRDMRAQGQPGSTAWISVDFPLLSGAPVRRCRVEAWVPPPATGTSGGDLAGLVIVGERPPSDAVPARLAELPSRRDLAVKVFGFPRQPQRQDNGAWATARLQGRVGSRLLQLDSESAAAIRMQPGYSGSPIVGVGEADDEVLGMLVAAGLGEEERDAYAISVEQLAEAWPDVLGRLTIPACPYRGLDSYTAEDAAAGVFVGREEEIEQLREMLSRQALAILTGPSGVGKSSLVNAGLVRMVRDSGWMTQIIQPGPLPLEAVSSAFAAAERPGTVPTVDQAERWASRLRSDGLALAGAKLAMATGRPLLLCIDQFEQVFDPETCTRDASGSLLDQG